MSFVLRNLRLDAAEVVSLVDKGASGNAEHRPAVVLFKRDASNDKQTLIARIKAALTRNPQEIQKMKTLEQILAELGDEDRAIVMEALQAKAEAPKPEGEAKAEDEPKEDEAMKLLPESLRKRFEAEASEKVELQKRLAKIEDERETETFTKRASELAAVPGASVSEMTGLLKRASRGLSRDDFAALNKVLDSANALIAKGAVLREHGRSVGAAEGSAVAEIEARANALIAKGADVSLSKAKTMVVEQDPSLYARYKQELQ